MTLKKYVDVALQAEGESLENNWENAFDRLRTWQTLPAGADGLVRGLAQELRAAFGWEAAWAAAAIASCSALILACSASSLWISNNVLCLGPALQPDHLSLSAPLCLSIFLPIDILFIENYCGDLIYGMVCSRDCRVNQTVLTALESTFNFASDGQIAYPNGRLNSADIMSHFIESILDFKNLKNFHSPVISNTALSFVEQLAIHTILFHSYTVMAWFTLSADGFIQKQVEIHKADDEKNFHDQLWAKDHLSKILYPYFLHC